MDTHLVYRRLLTAFALLTLMPSTAAAQIAKSPPAPGATAQTMIPGQRYRAGGLKRWMFGSDYRDLWTTAIEAPVLNLDSVGGGLTPFRTGGFGQSITLHFHGNDGRRYVVRSMDKDPTQRLLPQLRDTFVEDIIQDLISALHPTAALVVDPLLDATDVLHATHHLVIVPDDPRLGEFREPFAGLLGMLVLHPDEGADDTPGFAGSRRISGSDAFLEALEDGPCDRVDARQFLKARLIDMIVGDKDRHVGQWRWASFPTNGDSTMAAVAARDCRVWLPIPEDRDQAFISFDGFSMWVARRARPQQIKFDPEYPNITGLTFNGWELDRELLAELEQPDWDSVVTFVQQRLTDSVIEHALRRLPPPHYESSGEFLEDAIEQRRDALGEAARAYYRLISRWADVRATDQDEYVDVEHLADGDLTIQIGLLQESTASRQPPYFRRTFDADVTKEVRVYMLGGDDLAEVAGGDARITIRAIGGGGTDRFVNTSRAGGGKTRFYDDDDDSQFERGRGAKVDQREFERPPSRDLAHQYALDWGGRSITFPIFSYSPDLGLYFGIQSGLERYGFRKVPFKTSHRITAGGATNGPEPFVAYDGRFRHVGPRLDALLHFEYSGINILRFHGFGNETDPLGSSSFFKVEQRELVFGPALEWQGGGNRGGQKGSGAESLRQVIKVGFGPIVKWSDTPQGANAERFIGGLPTLYGTGSFGQVGGRAWFTVDTRDNSGYAKRGVLLTVGGSVWPEVWDVAATFGEVHGSAATYLTARIPTEPTLAVRAGGKKVWGSYPFHEAAYVGGASNLRGFYSQRFAGDEAVYGNAELRFRLGQVKFLVPSDIGLFGLADVGRVFFDGDPVDADAWHAGYGGGLWWSFIDRLQTLTIAVVNGDDLTGVYVRAGFMF